MSRLTLKLLEVGFAAVFLKDPPATAEYARTVSDHAAPGISRVFAEARAEVRVAIGDHGDDLPGRDHLDSVPTQVRDAPMQPQGVVQQAAAIQEPDDRAKQCNARGPSRSVGAMLAFY